MQIRALAAVALTGTMLLPQHVVRAQTAPGKTANPLCPFQPTPVVPRYPGDLIHILADHATLNPHGTSRLEGHAQLSRGDETLLSDAIDFNNTTQVALSNGPLTLESPALTIAGSQGEYNLKNQTGSIRTARYHLYPMHAHGQATLISRLGPNRLALNQATYSTCPVGHRAWTLSASKVHLDQKADVGTARNVLIRFKGIPILYSPYLSFPLSNRRKSGLLAPTIGQSTNAGFQYRQPIYWNIAPQADATISPEIYSKRGFGTGLQMRYLGHHSHSEFDANYLPHDKLYGSDRYQIAFLQGAALFPGLTSHIDYNRVSDPNYFNDLGATLQNVDTTFLTQNADLAYRGDDWSLTSLVQQYQILNPTLPAQENPYEILPAVEFDARIPGLPHEIRMSLYSQWARFIRPNSVIGNRLDLMPRISFPLSGASWFFRPSLAYRYTRYRLQHQIAGQSAYPVRELPIESIDSGVYFERSLGSHIRQTLEPRLFYLYVPYRNQQALPVFDTALFPLSFSQLFNDNRFVGADRVSNANQLTAAITTRFLNTETGSKIMSASLGQIFYFTPQLVTLPGQTANTGRRSDYVTRLGVAISRHWWANAGININPDTHKTDTATFDARYSLSRNQLINLGYQYYRNQYSQESLSFAWPLSRHWQLATSWSYSLRRRRLLQSFTGLQYDSCCWAFRMLAERYLTTLNGSYNNGIFFELVLKGLGNLGSPIGTYLKRTIPDYVPPA